MLVVVRRGFLRAGWITVDGVGTAVRRGRERWYIVNGSPSAVPGRVRYDDWRDRAVLERPDESVQIRFRSGESVFEWRGREYRLGSMLFGRIRVTQAGRHVLLGRVTTTGVRLEPVAHELLPIIRELAFLLALRSEAIAMERAMYARLNSAGAG